MNRFAASRSLSLWLIIFIFGFITVAAQDNLQAVSNSTEKTESVSGEASSSEKKKDFVSIEKENNFKDAKKASFTKPESEKNPPQTSDNGDREWGFYAGSFTVHKDLKGESQRAPVFLVGIRYAWTTKNTTSNRFRYYMDFVPLHYINYRQERVVQTSPTTRQTISERKTAVGIGFSPIGIQFNWRNDKTVQPFIAGGLGMVVFNKRFPDFSTPEKKNKIGNWFQITADFGFGLEFRRSEKKSFFVGYKYHHMSNGYSAPLNVGYNTNMIYAGMYFKKNK